MKYYLASGFFTNETRENVKRIALILRKGGHEVHVPMEHEIINAWDYDNQTWAKMVFEEDIKAIRNCDRMIMLDYGMNNDSGASWECGFAYGIGKPCIVLPYDKVCSLMVGCSSELLKVVELK